MTEPKTEMMDPFGRPLETDLNVTIIPPDKIDWIIRLRDALEAFDDDDVEGPDLDMPLEDLIGENAKRKD